MSNGSETKRAVAGTVALVGRTNAGKSVLLNRVVGEKLAIVSPLPQTTRNRITGVYNGAEGQIVFVDTPGFHSLEGRSALNQFMVGEAEEALRDVDAVVLVVDAATRRQPLDRRRSRQKQPLVVRLGPDAGLRKVAERVVSAGKPVVLVLNKVDAVRDKTSLLPQLAAWAEVAPFAAVVPVSGLKGTGVPALLSELAKILPKGNPLFSPDELTDRTERFLVAEMVREQLFLRLRDELPYAVAVEVEQWQEGTDEVTIDACVLVERDSQKRIVVGKGGTMVRDVGAAARQEAQRLLGRRVHLKLFVKVAPDWTTDQQTLERLGYR